MLSSDLILIFRLTRRWIHYGFLFHVTTVVLIAGIEGLLEGR